MGTPKLVWCLAVFVALLGCNVECSRLINGLPLPPLQRGTDAKAIASDALPRFEWGSGNSNDGYEMTIEFNDGRKSDVALLKKSSLEEGALPSFADCVLFGSLKEEEDAYIAVNGCPGSNTFKVVLTSNRTNNSALEVINGGVRSMKDDVASHRAGGDVAKEYVHSKIPLRDAHQGFVGRRGTLQDFTLRLSLNYDSLFLHRIGGGDKERATWELYNIVNLAKPWFKKKWLGIDINLQVVEYKYVGGDLHLCASCDYAWETAKRLSKANPLDADNYHYFSHDTKWGTAGTANMVCYTYGSEKSEFCGSICEPNKEYRTAITEWMQSDVETSFTFAHELGHGLGMPHDFCTDEYCEDDSVRNYGRLNPADRSENCAYKNSIMDYMEDHTNWSGCSKYFMAGWFDDLSRREQNCKGF